MPRIIDFSKDPPEIIASGVPVTLEQGLSLEIVNAYSSSTSLTNADFIGDIDWFKVEEGFTPLIWAFSPPEGFNENSGTYGVGLSADRIGHTIADSGFDVWQYQALSWFRIPTLSPGKEIRFKIHGGYIRPGELEQEDRDGNRSLVPGVISVDRFLRTDDPPSEDKYFSARLYATRSDEGRLRPKDITPISRPIFESIDAPKDDDVDPAVADPEGVAFMRTRTYYRITEDAIYGGSDTTFGSDVSLVVVLKKPDNFVGGEAFYRYRGVISMSFQLSGV